MTLTTGVMMLKALITGNYIFNYIKIENEIFHNITVFTVLFLIKERQKSENVSRRDFFKKKQIVPTTNS